MSKTQGFIVVSDASVEKDVYGGIAQYLVWPLDGYTDPTSILLSDKILYEFCSDPKLNIICTMNHDLIAQYLQHCQDLKIPTKLFWIEAYDKYCTNGAVLAPSTEHCVCLGVDYIYSADASYLFDDGNFLFRRFPKELSEAKSNMTPYGLFHSFSDAICYAEYRATLDTEREGLEDLSYEVFAAIYQITRPVDGLREPD